MAFLKKNFSNISCQKINDKNIETIFINREHPFYKILKLPELIFKINRFLKKSQKKIIIIEGASWIFYSFIVLFSFKFFCQKKDNLHFSFYRV